MKRLFIDESYVLASSERTSTASSLDGEVVLGGGSKPLRLLNAFLEEGGVKTINQPQMEWNECTDRTKRRYAQHTADILVAVLKVVSPENAGYLWSALQASKAVNDELGVEGILHPSQRMYLEAIAETYKNASSWDTRRQILSVMTGTASLASIREYIPGLLQYRYTEANLHRLQHGIGTPVPNQPAVRLLVDETQLDHFLQFITSPHIVQDLPFGEKSLRLSNGSVLEVPNVIRALIPERITCQYKQYCQGFSSAKEAVMTALNVKHPVSYDQYNICSMVKDNTLRKLKLDVLKLLCENLSISMPPDQRKKASLHLSSRRYCEKLLLFFNNVTYKQNRRNMPVSKGELDKVI